MSKGAQQRERNHQWVGGETVTEHGYVLVRVGKEHHLADCRGYAYAHRLAAEEKIGRRLAPGEEVHHRDDDTSNNDHDNLEVLTKAEHRFRHRKPGSNLRLPGQLNETIVCACGCGQSLKRFDSSGRPRRFLSGHNTAERNRASAGQPRRASRKG